MTEPLLCIGDISIKRRNTSIFTELLSRDADAFVFPLRNTPPDTVLQQKAGSIQR